MEAKITKNLFSKHLFWDVTLESVSFEEHKDWFIVRVVEYGTKSDWTLLKHLYPISEILSACQSSRSLDPVALNYVAAITNSPLNSFRCYNLRQSAQHYTN